MLLQPSPISLPAGLWLWRSGQTDAHAQGTEEKDQELLDQADRFPSLEHVQMLNIESRTSQIPLGIPTADHTDIRR